MTQVPGQTNVFPLSCSWSYGCSLSYCLHAQGVLGFIFGKTS